MRTVQQTRYVATIAIVQRGTCYVVTEDTGELDGLADEDGRPYMPRVCDTWAEAYDHAQEVASELAQTPVDRREARPESYLVQIEDHTDPVLGVQVLRSAEE